MDYSGSVDPRKIDRIQTRSVFDEAGTSVYEPAKPASEPESAAEPSEVATRGGTLSDKEARRLRERREPGDVKFVLQVTDSPSQYLSWRAGLIEAQRVDYVRVHVGNLEERLAMHKGGRDVPSGRKESKAGYDESPFEINRRDYRLLLKKGKSLFQFIYYNWSYADEDGGPSWDGASSYSYDTVESAPDGWLTIAEVEKIKDQNQSSITRAIRRGDLNVVMQTSPRKRFVKPDEKLDQWTPGRQKNFLLRRRLKLVKKAITSQLSRPETARTTVVSDLMEEVKRREIREHGAQHVPKRPLQAFFEDQLGSDCPQSIKEWVLNVGELISRYCR
jgi:hypothetical protein